MNYDAFADTALRLLSEHGQDIVLSSSTDGTYSTSTGLVSGASATSATHRGVSINYALREIDGTKIQQGDKKVILPATSSPKVGDLLTFGGVAHRALDVLTISPGGTTIAHIVQARRGG